MEESIARHKAHIIKLELILRLLDNDELSAEQVNDAKEHLEDYVERNQVGFSTEYFSLICCELQQKTGNCYLNYCLNSIIFINDLKMNVS